MKIGQVACCVELEWKSNGRNGMEGIWNGFGCNGWIGMEGPEWNGIVLAVVVKM